MPRWLCSISSMTRRPEILPIIWNCIINTRRITRSEAVFAGTIDPILEKKVAHASFDERLSVIGLLLAGLNDRFRRVYRKERMLETLMKLLRKYQAVPESDGIASLLKQTEAYRKDWQMKRENSVLSGQEEQIARDVTACLDTYARRLREQMTDSQMDTDTCSLQIAAPGSPQKTKLWPICRMPPARHWSMSLILWKPCLEKARSLPYL